ncbi:MULTISPECIES: hypothetical protein [Streptomyces]|uniref:Lipoprotein n=1 Tax=Streptomyces fuscus TaxID=3048495 RepID=A0ABT7IUP9_9ACTN|nr:MULTISPECIES: hypothetical protein [Streptomyces]MCM1977319.1 hypothetical protein [Streptomyces sp. G1]MDL2076309.1 hypothetical protein [Streptomyces fuscus]SBT88993.1 hypothetical protein GA0115233_100643 [Streptomyces sp. DI166]
MAMKGYRWCAGIAALWLLTACGGGGDSGEVTALTKKQAQQALPDKQAMAGWREQAEPLAIKMEKIHREQACPSKGNAGCEKARYYGTSTFRRDEKPTDVTFLIITYDSEESARKAYDVLWDGYYGDRAGPEARTFDIGPVGDERDARFGSAGFKGEPGAVAQARVGSVVLWTLAAGLAKGTLEEDEVRDLTEVFVERAQQAHDGKTPSAALGD